MKNYPGVTINIVGAGHKNDLQDVDSWKVYLIINDKERVKHIHTVRLGTEITKKNDKYTMNYIYTVPKHLKPGSSVKLRFEPTGKDADLKGIIDFIEDLGILAEIPNKYSETVVITGKGNEDKIQCCEKWSVIQFHNGVKKVIDTVEIGKGITEKEDKLLLEYRYSTPENARYGNSLFLQFVPQEVVEELKNHLTFKYDFGILGVKKQNVRTIGFRIGL